MSARGGTQRRLIATSFVAGLGALLVGAVASSDGLTATPGDTQKEAKAVAAHDVGSQALSQLGATVPQSQNPVTLPAMGQDKASQALRQSGLPASRRQSSGPTPVASGSSQQQAPATHDENRPASRAQQIRLPELPSGTIQQQPVIPVAAHELASLALQQAGTPSSRRQQGPSLQPAPAPKTIAQSEPLNITRLTPPVMPVSAGSQRGVPAIAGSANVGDEPRVSQIPYSALRTAVRQDNASNSADSGAAQQPGQIPDPAQDPETIPTPQGTDTQRTFGERPEDNTREELFFLRQNTILLQPGEYQFDISMQYLVNSVDSPTLALLPNNSVIATEVVRRQRIMAVPLELRFGISPDLQGYINVPFGWSNTEVAFAGTEEFQNIGGIGDINFGLTRRLVQGNEVCPEILGTVGWSAPTGQSSLLTTVTAPGTNLGEGFWTMRGDLSFIHNYDPIVVYYGFGYRHRFNNEIDGFDVDPGQQAYYRLGVGFAVNPQVTLSTTFLGSYIGSDVINGNRVAGGIREPMTLRFAATVAPKCLPHGFRLIEPYVNLGLTEEAIDTLIGVTWTR